VLDKLDPGIDQLTGFPLWIDHIHRIISHIGIEVELVFISYGIGGEEPSGDGIIIARLHISETGFIILYMTRVTHIVAVGGGIGQLFAEGGITLSPGQRT